MGDFNYKYVDWIIAEDHKSDEFIDIIQDNFLLSR